MYWEDQGRTTQHEARLVYQEIRQTSTTSEAKETKTKKQTIRVVFVGAMPVHG